MTIKEYYRWLLKESDAYARLAKSPLIDQSATIRVAGQRDAFREAAAKLVLEFKGTALWQE